MRQNPLEKFKFSQPDPFCSPGLAQIPSSAIAYIEAQMVQELSRIAARKITVSFVSKSIIKAHSQSKTASDSTQNSAENA